MKNQLLILLLCFYATTIFSQDFKFGKVSVQELQEKVHPLDSTADASYLYKYRKTAFNYTESQGFTVVTEIHERIKIYTKAGFEKATQSIKYYKPDSGSKEKVIAISGYTFNLEKGRVKKEKLAKKNIFDEKTSKFRSVKKITMPSIKVGSVIDLKYKIVSPYFDIKDLEFQHDVPVKNLEFIVEIPEYYKFNSRPKGYYYITPIIEKGKGVITSTVKIRENNDTSYNGSSNNKTVVNKNRMEYLTTITNYNAKNIPGLKNSEPYVSSINNYKGGLKFELTAIQYPNSMPKYYSTTWPDVARRIYDSSNFGEELKRTSYFKNDLKTILSKATTPSQKIASIFNFVKMKVKWNGYYGLYSDIGVRKAYREGAGNTADINLMLIAMLNEAGIEANPVLVSTRDHGVPFFPTIDGFNYVIAAVNLPTGYILLDATEFYSMPNVLPLRALNWKGRLIKKDKTSSWLELTSKAHSVEDNFMSIKINEDFTVNGRLRTTYKNLDAINFRSSNNHLKEDGVITSLEDRFGVEIEDYKVVNKAAIYKPVIRNISFVGEDFIEVINDKVYLSPLLFLTSRVNPFKLEDRKFPVDFGAPFKNKNSVFMQIPEGYKVESIPESSTIGIRDNLGVYGYKVVVSGNKINIISQLQINSGLITPEYYKELKEFYNLMVKKQMEKIVLVKE
ncbi:DUF3857 domain-containing protein [Polaribacter gochangensis]|uniref:DUF3857 domain-containing protein n=1 Tax=Polaribacter gochangensis TaxID=3252903 RepID=UPI003904B19F